MVLGVVEKALWLEGLRVGKLVRISVHRVDGKVYYVALLHRETDSTIFSFQVHVPAHEALGEGRWGVDSKRLIETGVEVLKTVKRLNGDQLDWVDAGGGVGRSGLGGHFGEHLDDLLVEFLLSSGVHCEVVGREGNGLG